MKKIFVLPSLQKAAFRCLLLIAFFQSLALETKAQVNLEGICSPFFSHIDSALMAIRMERSDLAMPYDVVRPDAHRLSVINSLFQNPLATFNYTEDLKHQLKKCIQDPQALYTFLAKQLDISPPEEIAFQELQFFKRKDERWIEKNHPELYSPLISLLMVLDLELKQSMALQEELPQEELERLQSELFYKWTGGSGESDEEPQVWDILQEREAQREGMKKARSLFQLAAKPSLKTGFRLAAMTLERSRRLAKTLENYTIEAEPKTIYTKIGPIHFGSAAPKDAILIIGSSGDDKYEFGHLGGPIVLIDPAGNDSYESKVGGIAAGFFINAILIDVKGKDVYRSKDFAQGAGFYGHGFLEDQAGDDHYISSKRSQAFGCFGTGLLLDSMGNDVYEGNQYVQAVGFTKGFGALLDFQGNDTYLCTGKSVDIIRYEDHYTTLCQGIGMGYRPIASGGLALLADYAGNDTYTADIYGQGTSYWFAFGSLIDEAGHDNYLAYQYAQGSGVHMGFSALIDKKGRDLYRSNGVSQGCGHDYAFGGLMDLEGFDSYICEGLSQGGGNANAVSVLIDAGGRDAYIARDKNTMGYSDTRRDYGMVGLFLDLDGEDQYGSPKGKDGTAWVGSTYGAGWDWASQKQEKQKQAKAEKKDDSLKIAENLATDIDRLFVQASASNITQMYLVDPARDALVEMGDTAVKFLMAYIRSDLIREIHALRFLLPRFGELPTPYLVDSLQNGSPATQSAALTFLYWMGRRTKTGKGSIPEVKKLLSGDNEKLRAKAVWVLGMYKDSSLLADLVSALQDPYLPARRNASFALFKLKHSDSRLSMLRALDDVSQQVRHNVERYIALLADEIEEDLLEQFLSDASDRKKWHILNGIERSRLKNWQPNPVFWSWKDEDDVFLKAAKARLVLRFASSLERENWEKRLEKESHALLRGLFNEF